MVVTKWKILHSLGIQESGRKHTGQEELFTEKLQLCMWSMEAECGGKIATHNTCTVEEAKLKEKQPSTAG